jgi:hypothetical protein
MSDVRLSARDRRIVLQQLSRDRLSELTNRFELEVTDRRSIDAHVDTIVRKRSLDFRRVLEVLRREELQAACEALGLDSGGREKAMLVGRILGDDDAAAAPSSSPASTSSSAPPPMTARSEAAGV